MVQFVCELKRERHVANGIIQVIHSETNILHLFGAPKEKKTCNLTQLQQEEEQWDEVEIDREKHLKFIVH